MKPANDWVRATVSALVSDISRLQFEIGDPGLYRQEDDHEAYEIVRLLERRIRREMVNGSSRT